MLRSNIDSRGKNTTQSARQFAYGNLSPLRKGIEVQLTGLKKNVERLSLSASVTSSKALGRLVVRGER
ncbi:MAG: hypothetical protein GX589_01940 [Deltaproteobacteria bacterium]|nr:hypothetical protein [Deltaproteobacteria bacterium]